MGEISAASHEQSQGVAQVGEAVTQMDQTTQQNAALVEEMAAAASSLNHQAQSLVEAVVVFKLSGHEHVIRASASITPRSTKQPVNTVNTVKPAVQAISAKSPAPRRPAAIAGAQQGAGMDNDWEAF